MLVTQEPRLAAFWYPLAFAEEVGERPLARRLLGVDLVVWRSGDEVLAARDRCPHRDARLTRGWVCEGQLVCAYHGWEYGPDGRASRIPQLSAGTPIPPAARLALVRTAVSDRVVWAALDEPACPLPVTPGARDPSLRWLREFDEVWECAAARLIDNSFDPAHIAFVHRDSFGDPARPAVEPPALERTSFGFVMRNAIEVDNPDVAVTSTGTTAPRTVRTTTSSFYAPFLRVMEISYPSGRRHSIVTSATPVDDTHLRLVHWCLRGDTEEEAPGAEVVAFDRQVTLEDQALLESTWPDYALDLTANVHLKIDRPTIEVRRILGEICAGTWAGMTRPPGTGVPGAPTGTSGTSGTTGPTGVSGATAPAPAAAPY